LKDDLLKKLIQRIYKTAEEEIDCDQTRDLLAAYVDAQVADTIIDSRFDELRLHLDQCPDCTELYESLLQVSQMQSSGELPPAGELLAGLTPDNELPSRS
jgi:hypothetical protein